MRATYTFEQGSDAWKAHRARPGIFNGSELAAIMGLSKKVTRNEMLHRKATNSDAEFSDWMQTNILDKGHEYEALARPLAEEYIGEDLSAMCMSDTFDGVLISVSLDGITQSHAITLEHKSLNKDLVAALDAGCLPEEYHPQCEAGLMVSGAISCLFMASKDGDMATARFYLYESRPELRPRIIASCKQFEKDLAAYVPPVIVAEAVAAPVVDLPAVVYEMNGLSLTSNLSSVVKPAVLNMVARYKAKPVSDQDFADLDAFTKKARLSVKKSQLFRETFNAKIIDVDTFNRGMIEIEEILTVAAIAGEKTHKAEIENRKNTIRATGPARFNGHVNGLQAEIQGVQLIVDPPDFIAAGRGLSSLKSLENAIDTCLANAIIKADASAADIRDKLRWYRENAGEYQFLFNDLQQIIGKQAEDFQLLAWSRIDNHKAVLAEKLDAERKRIIAEATAKADREADAKIKQESVRIRAEERAKAAAEQKRGKPQVGKSERANTEAQDQLGENKSTPPYDCALDFQDRIAEFMDGMDIGSREYARIEMILLEFVRFLDVRK